MDYKNKSPEHWRTYLINGINNRNPEVAIKTSNFMVDNLVRYLKEERELSQVGYESIMKNWDKINQNTNHSYHSKRLAKRFLRIEKARLENESWDEPRVYKEKSRGFFSRFRVSLRLKFA